MAFFDKLGETLSTKSKDVAKKAKDFADVAKLNSQISSEQEGINAAYLAIGRACYEQNRGQTGMPYDAQFQAIDAAMGRIAQLQKEIQVIKGIRQCPACGSEMPAEAVFCPACGTKSEPVVAAAPAPETQQAPTTEVPAQKVCPSCGTELPADGAFCPNCGAKV